MNFLLRLLLSAAAVVVLSYILPNVTVDGFVTALIVAIVLSLLNFIVKPIMVLLTFPITVLTFGLFLLVINACIIMLADYFVDGFNVDGIGWAILFSLLLSFLQSVLFSFFKKDKE